MAMAALPLEIGLGAAFTLISLAPFIPEWMKKPEGPHTTVYMGAGQPHLETADDMKHKQDIYNSRSFGGQWPNMGLFANDGTRIGSYKSDGVLDTGKTDSRDIVHWDESGGNGGAAYLTVSAGGGDAICISHIGVMDPTNGNGVGDFRFVPGEIAKQCNTVGHSYPWFPSDATMEIDKDSKQYYPTPACLMIDTDTYYGSTLQKAAVPFEGFTIRLMDFTKDNSMWDKWQNDNHHMCDSVTRFWMHGKLNELVYPNIFVPPSTEAGALLPIKEVEAGHPDLGHLEPYSDKACYPNQDKSQCPWSPADIYSKSGETDPVKAQQAAEATRWSTNIPRGSPAGIARRQIIEARAEDEARASIRKRVPFHKQLIKSAINEHSAIEVCNDKATVGPHFYCEREQMFCETDTHTLFPSCKVNSAVDCFDPDQDRIQFRNGTYLQERDSTYHSVKSWKQRRHTRPG